MAIPNTVKQNFEELKRTIAVDEIAVLEVFNLDKAEEEYALVHVGREGKEVVLTPIAIMIVENPYDIYLPPHPDGGFKLQDGTQFKPKKRSV